MRQLTKLWFIPSLLSGSLPTGIHLLKVNNKRDWRIVLVSLLLTFGIFHTLF